MIQLTEKDVKNGVELFTKKQVTVKCLLLEPTYNGIYRAKAFLGTPVNTPYRIDQEKFHEWCDARIKDGYLPLQTLESDDHRASFGDYIIQGVNGEFYSCKPDIHEKTYNKATPSSHQVEPSQPVKGLSEGVLGEIITGEECVRRGYSNDSMGQTINEDAAYADMLVRSKLLHQLTEIDNDGSYNIPDSLNYFAPANVGVSVDWEKVEDMPIDDFLSLNRELTRLISNAPIVFGIAKFEHINDTSQAKRCNKVQGITKSFLHTLLTYLKSHLNVAGEVVEWADAKPKAIKHANDANCSNIDWFGEVQKYMEENYTLTKTKK